MEFTNQLKKYVRFLHQRKHRQKYNKFIAEGPKICNEFLRDSTYISEYIIATEDWLEQNDQLSRVLPQNRIVKVIQKELDQISLLKTANQVLMVIDMQSNISESSDSKWSFYLDKIQDPGNMGAILRIADWYNVKNVYASADSVAYYNPKVVQSAMGAHNRLYLTSSEFYDVNRDSYGLCLDGEPIDTLKNVESGLLVIGNESKGISNQVMDDLKHKVTIPRLGGAESLNAAVACGIACHCLINSQL